MKHLLFILSLTLIYTGVNSQPSKKMYDCYAVTYQSDTIHGKTKNKGITHSSIFRMFKEKNDKAKCYPWSVQHYVIEGNKFDAVKLKKCKGCSEHVFMRRTIDGPLILYEYKIKRKDIEYDDETLERIEKKICTINYYIRKKGKDPSAILAYVEDCSADAREKLKQPFPIEDVAEYFKDYPKLKYKLLKNKEKRENIVKLVKKYNAYLAEKNK
jgi:hypothetical protein